MGDVTRILADIERGDPRAAEQLLPLVYDELRKLAAQKMAQENPGQTLQPTALVHEAYLRLVNVDAAQTWHGRGHFFGAAAEAMRRILIDQARRKKSQRQGGGLAREPLECIEIAAPEPSIDLLAVNEALERFEAIDQLKADGTQYDAAGVHFSDGNGAIPEPSSIILWGIGVLCLTVGRLRRRRRAGVMSLSDAAPGHPES
jgi:RNA polymerase sigma factor (TIGR02999 family)